MKLLLLIAALVVAAAAFAATSAHAGKWVPGSPFYITEQRASANLERRFDHVFCTGVSRFGHQHDPAGRVGIYWERYRVLDCDIVQAGKFCTARVRGVKLANYYWHLEFVRGDCH